MHRIDVKFMPFPLKPEQLKYLNDEKWPRWDLDPPQRENYGNDWDYTVAIGQYADRCIETELLERLGKPVVFSKFDRLGDT